MTVLAEYQRLEAEGIWRAAPDAQRRDVIVSIGKATITIAATNGTALTHWSLPAMVRLNPGEEPALYQPGDEAAETLEIADHDMVEAIERVLRAIRRGPAGRRLAGRALRLGAVFAILAAAVLWLPDAVTAYTASLVPEAARNRIGADLLAETERVAGTPCSTPAGDRALARLSARLFPEGAPRLVVLPDALTGTAQLPGGTILVSHILVEDHETPEVLAAHVVAETLRSGARKPLARLLAESPFRASLALLSTGYLREVDLARMAEQVVLMPPEPVADDLLIAAMAERGVATAPYAYAQDISGETTRALIERSPETAEPVLGDTDWIALQRICTE